MNEDWTNIEETGELPKDTGDVLMYGKEWDSKVCHGWYEHNRWYDCEWKGDPIEDGMITHWMPMPDLPKVD